MSKTRVEVPMSKFGFEAVSVTTPGYAEAHELVPELEPDYVFEKKSLMLLRAWWLSGTKEPLYISGPTGCGKTSLIEQFAARLNIPMISIMGRDPMEKADAVGMPWIGEDGAMRFAFGPASKAYGAEEGEQGCLLLINEFSAAPPGFWVANNEILEAKPIYIEPLGQVIKPKPGFRLVVTDNTRALVGDETGMLQSRFRQDASVIDRFWSMEMYYMETSAEIALLRQGLKELGEEMATRFAETLRKVAEKVREAYLQVNSANDAIETTLSTRTLLRIRDLILYFKDGGRYGIDPLQLAFEVGLTNKCSTTTKQVIHKIVTLEFGDLFKQSTVEQSAQNRRGNTLMDGDI
jgi:cobaltochelatase CobS